MKVLFLPKYAEAGASSRIRVYQYLPFLREKGIGYTVYPIIPDELTANPGRKADRRSSYYKPYAFLHDRFLKFAKYLVGIIMAGYHDVVFVQKVLMPIAFQRLLKHRNPNIVFDLDDSIFTNWSSQDRRSRCVLRQQESVSHMLTVSKQVVVVNDFIRDYALRYNNNTVVLTSPVDTERYFPLSNLSGEKTNVVIGWIGSPSTANYLVILKEVCDVLAKQYDNVVFEFVGAGNFKAVEGPRVVLKQWSLDREVTDLQEFDIGIMPLPDDEWTRGKGGYKLLQYMAVGIPVVASPVGINSKLIRNGVNGYLAGTNEEWVEKLSLLVEDKALRQRLGKAGRQMVEERYSLRVSASRLVEILASVCGDDA